MVREIRYILWTIIPEVLNIQFLSSWAAGTNVLNRENFISTSRESWCSKYESVFTYWTTLHRSKAALKCETNTAHELCGQTIKFQDIVYENRYTWNTKKTVVFSFKVISLDSSTSFISFYQLYNTVTQSIQRNVFTVQVIFYSLSLMSWNILPLGTVFTLGNIKKAISMRSSEQDGWLISTMSQWSLHVLWLCSCHPFTRVWNNLCKDVPTSQIIRKSLLSHLKINVQLILHQI